MPATKDPPGAHPEVIHVAVSGALGRMGSLTHRAVTADPEVDLAALVDPGFFAGHGPGHQTEAPHWCPVFPTLAEALDAGGIDVVIDFTTPSVVCANVLTCLEQQVAVVVGTTGLSTAELAEIEQKAGATRTPVLLAPNFALGAVLMMEFARQAARHFKACEIVELHHDRKLDAPSGTSELTRVRIEEAWHESGFEKDIPIHSVRLPGLLAHQEVIFGSLGETLTIRHDSIARESFMPGVLLAVKRVRSLQGLVVGLENVL